MSSIDERIVEMRFNNGQFQNAVSETMRSLEKLKAGLKLDGAAKGLSDVDAAGKKLDLSGIAKGVDQIASRFTNLGVVATTALVGIANQAVQTGVAFAKSIVIDPIMDGFREYETKMGSIQTILANTSRFGTTLDTVTASLDELNKYADKTIYNFGDMTRNIGLFTNAGIRVEDATSMIKGFSNEAAASGTSAMGAAGAAYQLSQALSAGQIRLMDWRSLTNVGMGNKNMQLHLIELAEAMGVLSSKSIDASTIQADFNSSLEKGWLTTEVMSNYLRIMAGDMDDATMASLGLSQSQIDAFKAQATIAEEAATKVRTLSQLIGTIKEAVGSSWSETFNLIFGDFDEATELFTNINDTIGSTIAHAGEARNAIISSWKDLGGRQAIIDGIANAFKTLIDIAKPIGDAFGEIFAPITGQNLADISTAFRDFTASLKVSDEMANNIKRTFKGVFAVFDIVGMAISGLVGFFGQLFGAAASGTGGILEFTGGIGDLLVGVRDAIKQGDIFTKFFQGLGAVLSVPIMILQALGSVISGLFDGIKNFSSGGFTGIFDAIGKKFTVLGEAGTFLADTWTNLKNVFQNVYNFLKPAFDWLGQAFSGFASGIGDAFANLDFNTIFAGINTGTLAAVGLAISQFFKSGSLDINDLGFMSAINDTFDALTGHLQAMQANVKADTLIKIAGAVALLVAALVALTLVDQEKLTAAIASLGAVMGELMGAMWLFQTVIGSFSSVVKLPIVAATMIMLAGAVVILAGAITMLGKLSWEDLAKGLVGVAASMGMFAGMAYLLQGNAKGLISSAIAMMLLGSALKIMASAMGDFAAYDWEQIGRSLVSMAGSMGILVGALRLMSGSNILGATSLVIVAAALQIIADVMQKFGNMEWDAVGKSMTMLAGSLGILAVALALMPQGLLGAAALIVVGGALSMMVGPLKEFGSMDWDAIGKSLVMLGGSLGIIAAAMALMPEAILGAAALIVVAGAINMMVGPMKEFGAMDWDSIGKSMVVLAGSLGIIALAMAGMTGALAGAAALIVVAAALQILAPVLTTLGNMSWDEIGKGLLMLAGAFGVIAIGGVLLAPVVPVLLMFAAAVLAIGAAVALAGVGLLAFSVGFAALAASAALGTAAIVAMINSLASTIPVVMQQIGYGILALAEVISQGGPQLIAAFTAIFSSMLASVQTLTPQIVDTVIALLLGLIEEINVITPPLIDAMVQLALNMLDALKQYIPAYVEAGMEILQGVLQGIADHIGEVVITAAEIITNFLNGISRALPLVMDAGANLIINFINSLANTIRGRSGELRNAGWNLASAIIDGMTGGLWSGVSSVISAAAGVAARALSAAKSALGIHSPSREFAEVGKFSSLGFAKGISGYANVAGTAGKNLGNRALAGVKDSMKDVNKYARSNFQIKPTITPVLDLSEVKKGAGDIPKFINKRSHYAAPGYASAKSISSHTKTAEEMRPVSPTITNIEFTQNNHSPQALSNFEIYRQTRNQMSALKSAIGVS